MTDRSPRVSTDQGSGPFRKPPHQKYLLNTLSTIESAPLLRDSGEGTEANEHIQRPSEEGIHSESATKEQLTTLTKILLVLSIALLLTTAVRPSTSFSTGPHLRLYALLRFSLGSSLARNIDWLKDVGSPHPNRRQLSLFLLQLVSFRKQLLSPNFLPHQLRHQRRYVVLKSSSGL